VTVSASGVSSCSWSSKFLQAKFLIATLTVGASYLIGRKAQAFGSTGVSPAIFLFFTLCKNAGETPALQPSDGILWKAVLSFHHC
jgi:hypothetical protein